VRRPETYAASRCPALGSRPYGKGRFRERFPRPSSGSTFSIACGICRLCALRWMGSAGDGPVTSEGGCGDGRARAGAHVGDARRRDPRRPTRGRVRGGSPPPATRTVTPATRSARAGRASARSPARRATEASFASTNSESRDLTPVASTLAPPHLPLTDGERSLIALLVEMALKPWISGT